MKPRVKICGITNLEDALFCAQAGANALGFIFYDESPRYVQPSAAAAIIAQLPTYVTPVGVFVNADRKTIERIIAETHIRIVQLSGDESPEDCVGFNNKIWKAFRIEDKHEVEMLRKYQINAAILDSSKPGMYGGSGVLPDFSIAREMKQFHPLVLAGGLNAENISTVIETVQPYAIDVNSGVESAPGKKDHNKIRMLFRKIEFLR